jgi:uncharacterized membrane protein HdeD (DUF308 family)
MSKSSKIWLGIAGCLLIVLGVVCICKPAGTLFATAWLIGCFTLFSGIFKLIFTFRTERFLPNSGSRMLSAIFQILLGIFFLAFNTAFAASLPLIFAIWVMVEGVIIAVQSFDYKRVGFPYWWLMLLLGIGGAVLSFFFMRNPVDSAVTLSTLIGIGIIALGVSYLLALSGIKKFEKQVEEIKAVL